MDFDPPIDAMLETRRLSERGLALPLVSLVIANRNYASYLDRSIRSIRQQDYPWFECIIIDNGSTDDSVAVIERAIEDDPRFALIRLAENLGQLGAVLSVFERLRGNFIGVIDADDMLFAEFLSWHVQAHLALPGAVGFTSSNIVEVDAEDRAITGGRLNFGAGYKPASPGLKSAATAVRLTTISDADYERLSALTVTVPHWQKFQWVWGPGTANVFRKSALNLTLPDASRIRGHAGFDNYFCTILHLMTGSALIHRRLSAYRFHGLNAFGTVPAMRGMRAGRSFAVARSGIQRIAVLQTILSRAPLFNFMLAGDRLWSTVDLLSNIDNTSRRAYFAQDVVQDVLAENFAALVEACTLPRLLAELFDRLDAHAVWRVAKKAHGGRVPLPLCWAFAREAALRMSVNDGAASPDRQDAKPAAKSSFKVVAGGVLQFGWTFFCRVMAGFRYRELSAPRAEPAAFESTGTAYEEAFPARFTPGSESNLSANVHGIWIDGWAAARCELTLAGGVPCMIGIEGTIPGIMRGFRTKLVVEIDSQQIGTIDLEPGPVSAAWPIPASENPRPIVLRFSATQTLAKPDTRQAAMLIREIVLRPDPASCSDMR